MGYATMALFMPIIDIHTRNRWLAAHVSNVAIRATVDSTQKVTPCGPCSVSKHNSASTRTVLASVSEIEKSLLLPRFGWEEPRGRGVQNPILEE